MLKKPLFLGALKNSFPGEKIYLSLPKDFELTNIDPWFLAQIEDIIDEESRINFRV